MIDASHNPAHRGSQVSPQGAPTQGAPTQGTLAQDAPAETMAANGPETQGQDGLAPTPIAPAASAAAHPPGDRPTPFATLQGQLRDRWHHINQFDTSDCDILVVPSLSLDQQEADKIAGIHHYEERLLFSLIRLRNPRTRLIYVTSQPLPEAIIDYYLQLLPGIPFSHARDRLLLLSTYDASHQALTAKILDRPRLVERIRRALRPDRAYMTCFNTTSLERELSIQLNLPLWGSDPALHAWGTKHGSRQIFAACGIPHPDGSDLVYSVDDLAIATAHLWERNPTLQRVVIKLDEGFSGQGNALLDLRPLAAVAPPRLPENPGPPPAHPSIRHNDTAQRAAVIAAQFPAMQFQGFAETWAGYRQRIPELGALAEAFVEGTEKRSPSVQGRINPDGTVEVLSTHEQILDGDEGQTFMGCSFPAANDYRLQLQTYGQRIGQFLAQQGCLERFGVDFLAVRSPGRNDWRLWAIEINLRKGGTTHPFMTLKYLTDGSYDPGSGLFHSRCGRPKYYVASDNLKSPQYRGLVPRDLMDIIAFHRLHFDTSTETGTVFHLMGALSEFGKLGLTSIGDSPEQARHLYDRVVAALDAETAADPTQSRILGHLPLTWYA